MLTLNLVLLIASYFVCFAFIYFCYSILTTLWNKVHSNFDPAYLFRHKWSWILFTTFQSCFSQISPYSYIVSKFLFKVGTYIHIANKMIYAKLLKPTITYRYWQFTWQPYIQASIFFNRQAQINQIWAYKGK